MIDLNNFKWPKSYNNCETFIVTNQNKLPCFSLININKQDVKFFPIILRFTTMISSFMLSLKNRKFRSKSLKCVSSALIKIIKKVFFEDPINFPFHMTNQHHCPSMRAINSISQSIIAPSILTLYVFFSCVRVSFTKNFLKKCESLSHFLLLPFLSTLVQSVHVDLRLSVSLAAQVNSRVLCHISFLYSTSWLAHLLN